MGRNSSGRNSQSTSQSSNQSSNQSTSQSVKLEELWIELINRKMKGSSPLTEIDWSPMKINQSLKFVRMDWNWHHQSVSGYESINRLIDCLPDQLEELVITMNMESSKSINQSIDGIQSIFRSAFESKTWLPSLKKFWLFDRYDEAVMIDLLPITNQSINQLTNHSRPIEAGSFEYTSYQSISQLPSLKQLHTRHITQDVIHQLANQSSNQSILPNLSVVNINQSVKYPLPECSFDLFLSFVSHRSITQLTLDFPSSSGTLLTRAGLRCLASINQLRFLKLGSAVWNADLVNADLSFIIPCHSWPLIESLDVSASNENVLSTMLAACPNVLFLKMRTEGAYHCLISHMKIAEKLAYFSPRGPPVTRLTTCIMRQFIALQSMYQLNQNSGIVVGWVMLREKLNLSTSQLEECIETKKPINKLASNLSLSGDRYLGRWRSLGRTWPEIAAAIYAPDPVYRQFKQQINQSINQSVHQSNNQSNNQSINQTISGRERYFEVLYSMLSEVEKSRLTAWDQGDYSYEGVSSVKIGRGGMF